MPPRRAYSRAQSTQPVRVRPLPPAAPYPAPPAGFRAPVPAARPAVPARRPRRKSNGLLWLAAGIAALVFMSCAALTLMLAFTYMNGILPGVTALGVPLAGLSIDEAAQKLAQTGAQIRLTDGQNAWRFPAADLGLTLDSTATARAAYEQGRSDWTSILAAFLGRVEVPPVLQVDPPSLQLALQTNADQFNQSPVNAGVAFIAGEVQSTPPQAGRVLDVAATVARVQADPAAALADGRLELVMQTVAPAITDSTPMLQQARNLLSSPLDIRIYDPITGDSVYWSAPPQEWASWLTAEPDSSAPTGLVLSAADAPVRAYLNARSAVLDSSRYLNLDEAVTSIQQGIRAGRPQPYARVYHRDRQYIVQAGETITSIAWDVGVPYLYIVQANGGLESVSVGQSITIPSPDTFLPYPVNPDKRIVVSISRQRTWVYENGQLKWEWLASTGIPDSPTWPGVYQIISHEPNAYAGNWNLWMPNFMGVYQPIPGADFTNGFHGFPTRGGSQLLWTNSLGTRVTYGCILLSNDNIQLLYNWAEEGVVVEIQA
ncbi:MAG: L,D-transpeptidase family protein [Anaerolineae bacterium]|nr:L,D-transpeptidase family protein [Anaerolineae bacterium]